MQIAHYNIFPISSVHFDALHMLKNICVWTYPHAVTSKCSPHAAAGGVSNFQAIILE